MDYLAYDAAHGKVWVPAGNTGRVDVIDTATGKMTSVENFPTVKQMTKRGERTMGPSSATAGGGMVFVGNRADSKVRAVDARTQKMLGCVALPSSPDGLAYMAATKEVWVTTPRDKSLTLLDVKNPAAPTVSGRIRAERRAGGLRSGPEGRVLHQPEDQDATLVIDAKTRKVSATWKPGCGEAGPRGLALDIKHHQLFVACTDHAVTLSTEKKGACWDRSTWRGGGQHRL